MERYKLISLLVSVKNEMKDLSNEIDDDFQELINDIETGQFKIDDVEIDYQELASKMIESCLDMAKDDNQNFSQVYLDCHINPELVSFVDVSKLLETINLDLRVTQSDNIYSDCYEIYFKEEFLK